MKEKVPELNKPDYEELLMKVEEYKIQEEVYKVIIKQLEEIYAELAHNQTTLEENKKQLEFQQNELKILNKSQHETLQLLRDSQNELIYSEKMASLGRMVAGFAHEINTPIGIAVTMTSVLQETSQKIIQMFDKEEIDEEQLLSELNKILETSSLTVSNLKRATNLISSFKRMSIDQTAELERSFNVYETIDDIFKLMLHNKFKKTKIEIYLNGAKDLCIYGEPGILDQIFTNLLINSLNHGFDNNINTVGKINIAFKIIDKTHIQFDYSDTGKGVKKNIIEKIFEPFYTTKRNDGGSGLGMYICYDLITNRLKGKITCKSPRKGGFFVEIIYPVSKKQ